MDVVFFKLMHFLWTLNTKVEVFILESLGKIDILNNTDVYNILIYTETNVCSYELLSQCPVL